MGIGLVMSAPVGPVNVMCSHRAFRGGFLAGFSVGLGATLADALYASLAVFGIVAVAGLVDRYDVAIKLLGGAVLLFYAGRIWRRPPQPVGESNGQASEVFSLWRGVGSGLILTLVNPGAIFGFLTIFAGIKAAAGAWLPDPSDPSRALCLVAGVVLGALGWWAFVAGMVTRHRHALPLLWLVRFNHGAAIGLGLLALWLWVQALSALGSA